MKTKIFIITVILSLFIKLSHAGEGMWLPLLLSQLN